MNYETFLLYKWIPIGILLLISSLLLVALMIKAWKTKTFGQYLYMYALLANMIIVWSMIGCEWTAFVYLQPFSTLLFSVKYFQTANKICKSTKGEYFGNLLNTQAYAIYWSIILLFSGYFFYSGYVYDTFVVHLYLFTAESFIGLLSFIYIVLTVYKTH